jgi:hypothetical protein
MMKNFRPQLTCGADIVVETCSHGFLEIREV